LHVDSSEPRARAGGMGRARGVGVVSRRRCPGRASVHAGVPVACPRGRRVRSAGVHGSRHGADGRSSGSQATPSGEGGVLMVAASQGVAPVPSDATFVPAHRCGTAVESHHVPSGRPVGRTASDTLLAERGASCQSPPVSGSRPSWWHHAPGGRDVGWDGRVCRRDPSSRGDAGATEPVRRMNPAACRRLVVSDDRRCVSRDRRGGRGGSAVACGSTGTETRGSRRTPRTRSPSRETSTGSSG
jgi:hypothetical protein